MSFHRHFNAMLPHFTLNFWDEIVKQRTVTYITTNYLNTIAFCVFAFC